MFKIKRNQIIITALVLMIAIAGYLNYMESTKPGEPDSEYAQVEDDKKAELVDGSGQEVAVVVAPDSDTEGAIADAVVSYDGENSGENSSDVIFEDVTDETIDESGVIAESGEADTTAITDETDITDETAITDETDETAASGETAEQPSTAVFVNKSEDSSFFVQAKLEREQSRAKERETMNELINNANVEKAQKALCTQTLMDIRSRIEKETAAEALIEAKGFAEAYVRIDENTVDVIVSKTQLSDSEIAQIEDIVKRKIGVESANIRISPLKPQ